MAKIKLQGDFSKLPDDPSWKNGHPGRVKIIRPVAGKLRNATTVRTKSIHWLWEDWMPLGHIVPVSGREGVGKSIVESWIAAKLTRGELPGDYDCVPCNVMIIASEDGVEDTWKPRLDLHNADLKRVEFWTPPDDWTVKDVHELRGAMMQARAQVVVIETLFEHVPAARGGENINSATFARAALGNLRGLMRRRKASCLFTMHPPKASGSDARSMFQASQAWQAVPRTTLFMDWHPEDTDLPDHDRRRVLVRGKGNIGSDPQPLEFRTAARLYRHDDGEVTQREYVADVRSSAVTRDQLLASPRRRENSVTLVDTATALLQRELIGKGEKPAAPILDLLKESGCGSKSTLTAAKERAGIKWRREGSGTGSHIVWWIETPGKVPLKRAGP